ncbi:hypothetical protein, partial [Streptomyces sp. NRRL S-15]|uniref:hypothetical protein n=1 Tax=Streptomyces sp. NRRL S-15 TaxID=1463886 RepID=UPI001F3AE67C
MARSLPKHGERACYLRGCRRPECCDANYRYMCRIRLEHERGQRRRTEAQPVADRVAELIGAGWTQAQIERATGVGHRTLSPLLSGQYPRVHATTARKILALPVGPPPADQLDTSAIGST